jgi:hypothetical protein
VILSFGACRVYGEPTRICKMGGLRREWYARSACSVLSWTCFSTAKRFTKRPSRNATLRLASQSSVSVFRRLTNRRAPTLARRSSKCPRATSPSLDDVGRNLRHERTLWSCARLSRLGSEWADALARARRSHRSAGRRLKRCIVGSSSSPPPQSPRPICARLSVRTRARMQSCSSLRQPPASPGSTG